LCSDGLPARGGNPTQGRAWPAGASGSSTLTQSWRGHCSAAPGSIGAGAMPLSPNNGGNKPCDNCNDGCAKPASYGTSTGSGNPASMEYRQGSTKNRRGANGSPSLSSHVDLRRV